MQTMSRKRERRLFKVSLLSIAVLFICSSLSEEEVFRRLSGWAYAKIEPLAVMEDGKPVMHTFYQRIDETAKNTGMSDKADEEMLAAWKMAWEDAGWATRVLTLDDAMKHVNFHYFNTTLRESLQYGRKFKEYDILCFFRWLALAMTDGGWSCDYDVFPLNPVDGGAHLLPNGGMFTAYEKIPRGAAVPSLVSATKGEYNRMSHLLVNNAAKHQKEEEFWTDFFSLIDLHIEDPKSYYIEDAVVPGKFVLTGHHFSEEDCQALTSGKLGVHFSHDAIKKGTLSEGESLLDRPRIGLHFLQMWRERCNDEPFIPAALLPSEPDDTEESEATETGSSKAEETGNSGIAAFGPDSLADERRQR